jgi:hypothetical protein
MRFGVGIKVRRKGGGKVLRMGKKPHRHGADYGARVDIDADTESRGSNK